MRRVAKDVLPRHLRAYPKENSMNVQATVSLMFPSGVVTQSIPDNCSFFEVHGLEEDSVPQNCDVLASGQFQFSTTQRSRGSYLVKSDDLVFFIRVYSTQSGGGHAEVALRYGSNAHNKLRVH
jgi:hypothetical protein